MHKALPYSFKTNNVCTDIDSIIPGMIYVDMNRKNNENFYTAFQKGASLIITDSDIIETGLPVIKVKDVEWAYLKLLDILNGNILDEIHFIAIYGGNQGNIVANILGSIFKKCYFSNDRIGSLFDISLFTSQTMYNFYIEGLFHYIMDCYMHNIKTIPLSMGINNYSLVPIICQNINCIIIDNYSPQGLIKEESFTAVKPIIINVDKPYGLGMINDKMDNFIITYGFNKKASVTATSINYGECTDFNYCLQRSFLTKSGNIVEPFETPLSIKGLGVNKLYAALASISCALYYDVDMGFIKDSLMDYSEKGRNLSVKEYDNFILIDNYCNDFSDLKETLDMVQLYDYQTLYLLISNNLVNQIQADQALIKTFFDSMMSSNVKEIVIANLTQITDNNTNFDNFIIQAKQLNISISEVIGLSNATIHILNTINSKDVLLLLGGKEFNSSKTIVDLLLTKEIF